MDSKTVFELRKEAKDLFGSEKLKKLNNALSIARKLYIDDRSNDWNQKAFAWILIDLSKHYIADKNLNQASVYFKELNMIDFQGYEDNIIENQKSFLRPKIDINYSEVQKAEELSKIGKNYEALTVFKNLISQNKLQELHHESYGWVIYKFIKTKESNLSSLEVRTFLRDYLNLKNERPSMLHSMILNFALNYSKTHSDFNFYKFLLMWNPENFRNEDLHNGTNQNGSKIPSLLSRICKEFVNTDTVFDIDEVLVSKISFCSSFSTLEDTEFGCISTNRETILDFFREPFFWKIFNAHKENRVSDLWKLFDYYNTNYTKYGGSKWHSEILNLAERFMIENEEWRFIDFFKKWNPENFRYDDWMETGKNEHFYKPLAIKAIKKAYSIIKDQTSEQCLSWLICSYEKAVNTFPDDKWLLREKALLHFKNDESNVTIKIYQQLAVSLADKYYFWKDFSDYIVSNNFLKIGMLSKALRIEKNEDFLGDIHLDLANYLINENLLENALIELEAYKKHRESKGWKISFIFDDLLQQTNLIKKNISNNSELYNKYIPFAESFAYADIAWSEFVLIDKWKDSKGEERFTFTDGKAVEFVVNKNHFDLLKQIDLGQILKFKLSKQKIKKEAEGNLYGHEKCTITECKYVPLSVEKSEKQNWEILKDIYAVVDYINKEKNIIHVISTDNEEIFFPQIISELIIGDFVRAKMYTKKVKDKRRTELRQIQKIDRVTALTKFQAQLAVIDGVNEKKQLFHFVISNRLQGIVNFTETNLRPNEGDFVKLSLVRKIDKNLKLRVRIVNIEQTEESDPKLHKETSGLLKVKYNEYNDCDDPDFAFVNNYYVPRYLLKKYNITKDCSVNARVIYTGDKWKVIDLVVI